MNNFRDPIPTEVWDFKTTSSRTINSFKDGEYYYPVLFMVDPDFCT